MDHLVSRASAAYDIVSHSASFSILIGGTSGCGKSTIASVLASRVGINNVISTDSIRHILRTYLDPNDAQFAPLWVSTYEAGSCVSPDPTVSEKNRLLQGYAEQCRMVCAYLNDVITDAERNKEPVIIEGVHLTPEEMINLMKNHPSVIPFLVLISNEEKHMERIAVRAKYLSLDPQRNKYVKNMANIRHIQKKNYKKAVEYDVSPRSSPLPPCPLPSHCSASNL
jgi:2-phosphoglycerate kinase